jgi:N-acetylmuramoyl-L-alanine amidase
MGEWPTQIGALRIISAACTGYSRPLGFRNPPASARITLGLPMLEAMDRDFSRREVVGGGLLLGLLALAGCQKQQRWHPLTQEELDGPPRLPTAGPAPMHTRPPILSSPVGPSGVIPRREWTTSPPNLALINPMNGINRITVHHDGMPPVSLRTKSDAATRLEQIRRAHVAPHPNQENKPWADIGYHYIIDPQGRIWEGRPIQYQGAHVMNNNEHNLGVMVLGNFDEQRPTSEALASLDAFVADRMQAYRVSLSRVFTHQEINPTACPGRNLQAYMVSTRSGRGRLASA